MKKRRASHSATKQMYAGSRPSVRGRRRDSRRWFETVPSLRTPSFSRFCEGRRRASRAPKAICALRCEVENGIHVLQRPNPSQNLKVPSLCLYLQKSTEEPIPKTPSHRSPTIGKILRPTTPSTGFTPLHSSSHQNNISTGIFCLQVLVIGIIWVTAFCVRSTFFLPSFQINQHEYNGAISQTVK